MCVRGQKDRLCEFIYKTLALVVKATSVDEEEIFLLDSQNGDR